MPFPGTNLRLACDTVSVAPYSSVDYPPLLSVFERLAIEDTRFEKPPYSAWFRMRPSALPTFRQSISSSPELIQL